MPFLAAPGGCGDSLVAEIHLFVHLHLILQAGQNELFSSVFLFWLYTLPSARGRFPRRGIPAGH